ncbi:hypothetical protein CAOG_000849 [Capsaspora owczarzaki ATCC 30864]|uniref:Nucleoporin Nup88 n=2 Tax=Capsaspora owczarzaki (strain ATCC 30864) TaxID=595528 RepID=A0A0D2U2B9_CAPO3|nr:hypothetical protein CAOG_000849 [Capsaspora owczarzaki ATCC 30864]
MSGGGAAAGLALLRDHAIFTGLVANPTTDETPVSVLPSAIAEHDGSLFVWDAASQALRVASLNAAISPSATRSSSTQAAAVQPTASQASSMAPLTGLVTGASSSSSSSSTSASSSSSSPPTSGGGSYQILAALKPPSFHVHSISVNAPGTHALLYGDHGIAVMELPTKSGGQFLRFPSGAYAGANAPSVLPNGSSVVPDNRVFCIGEKFFNSHRSVAVREVKWHPLSGDQLHIMVLSTDNRLRLYDLRQPAVEELLVTLRDPSADDDVSLDSATRSTRKAGLNANGDFSSRSFLGLSNFNIVSFDFGPQDGWGYFTIFCLASDGTVFSLCPVVPKQCLLPRTTVSVLLATVRLRLEQFLEQSNDREMSPGEAMYRLQIDWLECLLARGVPMLSHLLGPNESKDLGGLSFDDKQDSVLNHLEQLYVFSAPGNECTAARSSLLLQGPFLRQQSHGSDNFGIEDDACSLACLKSLPTTLVVAHDRGHLLSCILEDDLEAQWAIDAFGDFEDTMHLIRNPSLRVYERVDLFTAQQRSALLDAAANVRGQQTQSTPHPARTPGSGRTPSLPAPASARLTGINRSALLQVRMVLDPLRPHRLVVYHALGLHRLMFHWHEAMASYLNDDSEQPDTIDLAPTAVHQVINTWGLPAPGSLPSPVIGVSIVSVPSVGDLLVALTSQPDDADPTLASSLAPRAFVEGVVVRQLVTEQLRLSSSAQLALPSSKTITPSKTLAPVRDGSARSIADEIRELLQGKASVRLPTFAGTKGAGVTEDSLKFLIEAFEQLEHGYLKDIERAKEKIQHHAQSLEVKQKHQDTEISKLKEQIEQTRQAAKKSVANCAQLLDEQKHISTKFNAILEIVSLTSPVLSEEEQQYTADLEGLQSTLTQMQARMNDAKARVQALVQSRASETEAAVQVAADLEVNQDIQDRIKPVLAQT